MGLPMLIRVKATKERIQVEVMTLASNRVLMMATNKEGKARAKAKSKI